MYQAQPEGVERLARKIYRSQLIRTENVALFANQRVTPKAGLDSDLVALPGDEPDLDERGITEIFKHPVFAQALLAPRIPVMGRSLDERVVVPDQIIPPVAG